jgi:exonuclease III
MAKFLRIAHWNANGLAQHKDEVQLFLQHKIDILLVSETHFTTKSHFRILQYNSYYTNHPDDTAHAGTAILVKQTTQHYELSQYATDLLQATSICVRTFPFEMTVSALYSPQI